MSKGGPQRASSVAADGAAADRQPDTREQGARRASSGGIRRRLWRLLCWLALLGSIVALGAPWLTAHVWLGFDVFTHFRPHFAALALAAALCLLFPRRGWLPALLLLLITPLLLSALAWWRQAPPRTPEDAAARGARAAAPQAGQGRLTRLPTLLRVMSFNTLQKNHDLDAIEAEVRRQRPDVLGMVEFSAPKRPLLRRLRDLYPHQVHCMDKAHCNIALFSRWPIVRVRAASLWEGPPYLHATVQAPAGPLHVLVAHTLRFPWLGSQYKQVRALGRIVHRVMKKGRPVIVMGDFNATPFSHMLRTFRQHTGLKRLTWVPTWPTRPLPLPQIAIDHVFISEQLELIAGPHVGRPSGSDHLPVIVEIAPAR